MQRKLLLLLLQRKHPRTQDLYDALHSNERSQFRLLDVENQRWPAEKTKWLPSTFISNIMQSRRAVETKGRVPYAYIRIALIWKRQYAWKVLRHGFEEQSHLLKSFPNIILIGQLKTSSREVSNF